MQLRAVPPHESITPRRKQNFYEFAIHVFARGQELITLKDSEEFESMEDDEKELLMQEFDLLSQLNDLQVTEINKY